jgi:hypothetical protein
MNPSSGEFDFQMVVPHRASFAESQKKKAMGRNPWLLGWSEGKGPSRHPKSAGDPCFLGLRLLALLLFLLTLYYY